MLGPDADGALFEQAKIATQAGAGDTIAGERALRGHSVSGAHTHAEGVHAKPNAGHYEDKGREVV